MLITWVVDFKCLILKRSVFRSLIFGFTVPAFSLTTSSWFDSGFLFSDLLPLMRWLISVYILQAICRWDVRARPDVHPVFSELPSCGDDHDGSNTGPKGKLKDNEFQASVDVMSVNELSFSPYYPDGKELHSIAVQGIIKSRFNYFH